MDPKPDDYPYGSPLPSADGLDDDAILGVLERSPRNLEFDGRAFVEKHVTVESCGESGRIAFPVVSAAIDAGVRFYDAGLIYACWPGSPRVLRRPGITFVRRERWRGLPADGRVMPIAPDLTIEVVPVAPGPSAALKYRQYRDAGFGPVWVADLSTRTVHVHHADGTVTRLRGDDEITAGPVLPTFRRKVSELFGPATT